jgi:hypothetical protein
MFSSSIVVVTPKPSFAQAIRGPQVQFSDPLLLPLIRGDTLSIKIMHEAYAHGLEACKVNLRRRLNKGDKPYSSIDIVAKLPKLWKTNGQWRMLSLGRGYYEFSFASYEDL